jgi:hypothetical protein
MRSKRHIKNNTQTHEINHIQNTIQTHEMGEIYIKTT